MSLSAPKKKKNPWIKRLLAAGLVVLLAGAAVAWYIFNLKFEDTKDVKADYTVNAMDFLNQFKRGDSTINNRYLDKIIVVNGRVTDTETAPDSSINIKMVDTLTDNFIVFAFQDQSLQEAKKLKAGDSVSIKGSFSGGIYSEVFETMKIDFKRCTLNK